MATQGVKCETVRDGFVGELTEAALRVASSGRPNAKRSVAGGVQLWR